METAWQLELRTAGADEATLVLGGRWRMAAGLPAPDSILDRLTPGTRRLGFDAGNLADWDSGLPTLVAGLQRLCAARGILLDASGLPAGVQRLLALAQAVPEQTVPGRSGGSAGLCTRVGAALIEFVRGLPAMLAFLGEVTLALGRLLAGRARFRLRDLWLEIEEVGPRALTLTHFLVGLSKGSVYGAMIAFAGCLRGMQCGRSAAAVGHAATSAVVTAILLITIAASVMTIVYYQLGI